MLRLRVRARPGDRAQGWLTAGPLAIPVALGRGGILAEQARGRRRHAARRASAWCGCGGGADRASAAAHAAAGAAITRDGGWCEDPADRRYNRPFRRAAGAPGDRLWRDDRLYDFIVEIDHNTRPRVAGRGSAVFIHVARPGFRPTAGCVALAMPRLRWLLARVGPKTRIVIQ